MFLFSCAKTGKDRPMSPEDEPGTPSVTPMGLTPITEDESGSYSEDFLSSCQVEKGARTKVASPRRNKLLRAKSDDDLPCVPIHEMYTTRPRSVSESGTRVPALQLGSDRKTVDIEKAPPRAALNALQGSTPRCESSQHVNSDATTMHDVVSVLGYEGIASYPCDEADTASSTVFDIDDMESSAARTSRLGDTMDGSSGHTPRPVHREETLDGSSGHTPRITLEDMLDGSSGHTPRITLEDMLDGSSGHTPRITLEDMLDGSSGHTPRHGDMVKETLDERFGFGEPSWAPHDELDAWMSHEEERDVADPIPSTRVEEVLHRGFRTRPAAISMDTAAHTRIPILRSPPGAPGSSTRARALLHHSGMMQEEHSGDARYTPGSCAPPEELTSAIEMFPTLDISRRQSYQPGQRRLTDDSVYRLCFHRFDLTESGRIRTEEELQALVLYLVYRLKVNVPVPVMEDLILEQVEDLDWETRGLTLDNFIAWFEDKFVIYGFKGTMKGSMSHR